MPPQIDLSIPLTSFMLVDSFSVQRRQETVGSTGRNTIAVAQTDNVPGVVHPSGDSSLERPAESERQHKEIDVYTRFALRGASLDVSQNNWQPDLVTWNNNVYVVKSIEDWSKYGEGWIKAHCVQEDMTSVPPVTKGRIGP